MKYFLLLFAFFGGLYIYTTFGPSIRVVSTASQKQDLFTVTGEGKVVVIPDTGKLTLGISITRSDIKSAQTEANTVINKITESMKKMGVAEKDIKTAGYNIHPDYDYTDGQKLTGYRVQVSMNVTVRDLEKIGPVIDQATVMGVNTVGGIQFTIDDNKQKEIYNKARSEAIKNAKEKAQAIAFEAGITLGKIVNVSENTSAQPTPIYMEKAVLPVAGGGTGTQVEPGSSDITASVTLYYETK